MITHLTQFAPLSAESKEALTAITKEFEYKKGHIILKEDTTCHYLYFVASGATRTYYYKDGKDGHTRHRSIGRLHTIRFTARRTGKAIQ
jgi:CRP-like cAMP-binding protein